MTWDNIRKQYSNPYPLESDEEYYGVSPRYHPPGFVPYSSSAATQNKFSQHQHHHDYQSQKPSQKTTPHQKKSSPNSAASVRHIHKYYSCNCCPAPASFASRTGLNRQNQKKPKGGRKCEACQQINAKTAAGKKKQQQRKNSSGTSTANSRCCHCCCSCPCHQRLLQKEQQQKKREIDGLTAAPVEYLFAKRSTPKGSLSFDGSSLKDANFSEDNGGIFSYSGKNKPGSRYLLEDLMRGLQHGQWKAKLSEPVLENVRDKILREKGRERLPPHFSSPSKNEEGGKVYRTYVDFLTKDRDIRHTNTFKSQAR